MEMTEFITSLFFFFRFRVFGLTRHFFNPVFYGGAGLRSTNESMTLMIGAGGEGEPESVLRIGNRWHFLDKLILPPFQIDYSLFFFTVPK